MTPTTHTEHYKIENKNMKLTTQRYFEIIEECRNKYAWETAYRMKNEKKSALEMMRGARINKNGRLVGMEGEDNSAINNFE